MDALNPVVAARATRSPRSQSDEVDRGRSALFSLDPGCSRDGWLRILMAAKAAGIPFDEVHEWSQRGANYLSERDCRSVWRSIRPDGGIKAGTLFAMARDSGWHDNSRSGEQNSRRREWRGKSSKRPQEPPQASGRGEHPTIDFAAVWGASEPATDAHPYIARKLGLALGLRVYRGPLVIARHALDGALLVPAYDAEGRLQSWQAIPAAPGGKKLNATGASMSGARFVVGGAIRDDGPVYLCEGIGAAWSAHQASTRPAVCCFGAGNIERVAVDLHARHPGAKLVIVADRGKEADAERIARAMGGAWIELPETWPSNSDVNDLHLREGLQAVADVMAQETIPTMDQADTAPLRSVTAAEFVRKVAPPDYLLDGILQRGYVYSLTGPTGAGKTAVALGLGCCAALGEPFAGRETAHATVLYVASENPDDVRARVLAWSQHFGIPVAKLSERMHFLDESFVLFEREAELLAEVERVGATLVILDTDQAIAGSEDENANAERVAHAKRVRGLTKAGTRPCVVDLCHPPANAARTNLRPRGGSSFLAEVDGNIGLWRDDALETVEMFRTGKFRGPEFEPLVFELQPVNVAALLDSKGRPMTSIVALPTTVADDARKADEARERMVVVLRDVSMFPDATVRERADRLSVGKSTVGRVISDLCHRKAIEPTWRGLGLTKTGKSWLANVG